MGRPLSRLRVDCSKGYLQLTAYPKRSGPLARAAGSMARRSILLPIRSSGSHGKRELGQLSLALAGVSPRHGCSGVADRSKKAGSQNRRRPYRPSSRLARCGAFYADAPSMDRPRSGHETGPTQVRQNQLASREPHDRPDGELVPGVRVFSAPDSGYGVSKKAVGLGGDNSPEPMGSLVSRKQGRIRGGLGRLTLLGRTDPHASKADSPNLVGPARRGMGDSLAGPGSPPNLDADLGAHPTASAPRPRAGDVQGAGGRNSSKQYLLRLVGAQRVAAFLIRVRNPMDTLSGSVSLTRDFQAFSCSLGAVRAASLHSYSLFIFHPVSSRTYLGYDRNLFDLIES